MSGAEEITLEKVLKNPGKYFKEIRNDDPERYLETASSSRMDGLNKVRGVLSAVHRVKQLIKLADKYGIDININEQVLINSKIQSLQTQSPADFMLEYVGTDSEAGRGSPTLGSEEAGNKLAGLEQDLKDMENQITSKVFSEEGEPEDSILGIADESKDEFLEAVINKLTYESADTLSNEGSVQNKVRQLAGEMDVLDLCSQSDGEGLLEDEEGLEVVVEKADAAEDNQLLNSAHLEYVISQAKSRKILAEFIAAIDPARIAATARGDSKFDGKKAAGCFVDGVASCTATYLMMKSLGAAVAGPATAAVATAITLQQYWMISSQSGAENFEEQIKVLGEDGELAEPDEQWMTNLKRLVCAVAVIGRFADGWVAGQTLNMGSAVNATGCAMKGLLGMVDSIISLHNEGDPLGMGSNGYSQMFEEKLTKLVHSLLGFKTAVLGVAALSELPELLNSALGTNLSKKLGATGLVTMFGSVMMANLFKRSALQDAVGKSQSDKTTIDLISKLKEIEQNHGDSESGQSKIRGAFEAAGIYLDSLGGLISPTVVSSEGEGEGGAEAGCSLKKALLCLPKKIDALGTKYGPEWARNQSAINALAALAAISNGGTFSVGISKVLLGRVFGVDMETASRVGLAFGFSGGACLIWSQISKALTEIKRDGQGQEDGADMTAPLLA